MNRLTPKEIVSFRSTYLSTRANGKEMVCGLCYELLQYKQLEQELGIDLITLFKAIKEGVYYKVIAEDSSNYNRILFDDFVMVGKNKDDYGHWGMLMSLTQQFYFRDYGKTWALTREELQ